MSDVPPTDIDEPDDITVIEIQEEMESSFLDYAMSVIISRALQTCATASSLFTVGSSGECSTRDSARIATL